MTHEDNERAIGNSRGSRISQNVLEQCHIEKEAIMEVINRAIIIKPVRKQARENRAEAFQEMHRPK